MKIKKLEIKAGENEAEAIKNWLNEFAAEIEASASNPEYKKSLEEVKASIEALVEKKEFDSVKSEIEKIGLEIKKLQESTAVLAERGVAKGSIAETLAKNKERIDAHVKQKNKSPLTIMHEKSLQTETSTDIANRNYYDSTWHEPGVTGQIPVRQPFLRSLFKNAGASSEYIKYRDQNSITRSAANVALCATSNSTTKVDWKTNTIQISKVRDFVDVCLDMMNDYLFVESEIRNLINTSVALKIDDQLLVGSGTHPELNSLDSTSSAWAATIANITDYAGSVTNATGVDLLAIAGAQIRELGKMNQYSPNAILMNPGDLQKLKHLKNTLGDNVRFYPGFFVDSAGNVSIDGMRVVTNPNIANNVAYIGDFTKGTVYSLPGVGIEFSYENDTNFEQELVTVKAYERLNLLVRSVDANAFMKISDVAAAVTAITKV